MDPNATPGTAILTIVLRWQDGGRFANSTNREACLAELDAFFATHTEQVALAAQQAGIDFAEATAEAERKARRKKPSASDLELAERIQADVETPNPLTSE